MDCQKITVLLGVLFLSSLTAGAKVDNYTLTMKFDHQKFYAGGSSIPPGTYDSLDYPYIVSGKPAGIVSYGKFLEASYYNLSQDLVAYYPLDSTSGSTAEDASREGGDNNGTLENSPTWTNGKIDNSLSFDGTDDRAALQNLHYNTADSINELTVCSWLKTSSNANQIIAAFDRSEYWRFSAEEEFTYMNTIGFQTTSGSGGGDDMAGNTNITDGNWHHACVVYDSSITNDKKIYIDSKLDAVKDAYPTGTGLGTGATRYGYLGVGSEARSPSGSIGPSHYLNGKIDDLRIYHRALSEDEIQAVYRFDGGGAAQGDIVQVTQSSGSFLVPFTSGGVDSIERREEPVSDRSFLEKVKPSFSFFMPETPTVRVSYPFNHTVHTNISSISGPRTLKITNKLGTFGVDLVLELDK